MFRADRGPNSNKTLIIEAVTPSLFDLPLRLGDAASLASILLDLPVTPKPVTDDLRNRAAARAASLNFDAMVPVYASLERDPVHPSAYYICVDGVDGQRLLLRAAPATSPSSGLFPKAILIGRTFLGRHEAVLNAIPFSPHDGERIRTFSEQVNRQFLPKPFGSRPVVVVRSEAPHEQFPSVFEAFRRQWKANGQNMACFGLSEGQDPESFYLATVWAAIRSGWREGYTLTAPGERMPLIPGLKLRPYETGISAVREVSLKRELALEDILNILATE